MRRWNAPAKAGAWNAVVCCGSLDAPSNDQLTDAFLAREPIPGGAAVLAASRSLDRADWKGSPKLWIVTRGAQAIDPAERADVSVAQGAMWGLSRSMAVEHADQLAGMVDLDPRALRRVAGAQALAEVADRCCPGRRRRKRWRCERVASAFVGGATRYVAQASPATRAARTAPAAVTLRGSPLSTRHRPPRTLRLQAPLRSITGGLGGVGLHVARWLVCARRASSAHHRSQHGSAARRMGGAHRIASSLRAREAASCARERRRRSALPLRRSRESRAAQRPAAGLAEAKAARRCARYSTPPA